MFSKKFEQKSSTPPISNLHMQSKKKAQPSKASKASLSRWTGHSEWTKKWGSVRYRSNDFGSSHSKSLQFLFSWLTWYKVVYFPSTVDPENHQDDFYITVSFSSVLYSPHMHKSRSNCWKIFLGAVPYNFSSLLNCSSSSVLASF